MRLVLLTTLTMVAFAANSVLNRMALAGGHIDAVSFAMIRLAGGAVALTLLVLLTRGRLRFGGAGRMLGVVSLLIYLFGFSTAYTDLDAGLGALVLFGVVQITMFVGGLVAGESTPPRRWVGAALAFGGLIWLLWPGNSAEISLTHAAQMALAGVGWGLYSLAGRKSGDALMGTAANFVLAAPIGLAIGLMLPGMVDVSAVSNWGVALAIMCGAVTSGLGYALWYTVLPQLASSTAAVAQLTVPVIAMAGGAVLLGEMLTGQFVIAALLVLGGVMVSVSGGRR
ncbi:DMT family transporter [Pseudohalocynthiibacter aestuariivivens]|nr:DMT family transporter [Pseudohalocynthiibacter aestuariivivens]QIE45454.1 DMT family transporter [Pseudohalocynthiibacter aestuariivivens]